MQITQLQIILPQLLILTLRRLLTRSKLLLRLLQRLLQQSQLRFVVRLVLLQPQIGDQPPQQHADHHAANTVHQAGIHPASR